MIHQQVNHLNTLPLSAAANLDPQHPFFATIVHATVEEVFRAPARPECPAGKAACYFHHIFLGVSAVHAQCVKLHQLAGVVLVQPASAVSPASAAAVTTVGRRALEVVQVKKHGRVPGGGQNQVAELAQRVRADSVALIAGH